LNQLDDFRSAHSIHLLDAPQAREPSVEAAPKTLKSVLEQAGFKP